MSGSGAKGSGNGFGKSNRLLKPSDYQHVFRRARKHNAGGLAVYACPNTLGYPRLGIAISRKCTRSAVKRNRIKRAVREAFRVRKDRLGGTDIVFLAHAGAAQHDSQALREAIESHMIKLEQCEHS